LLYEKRKEYDLAKFAFKKMLQFAWFNNTTANEIHAYLGLAKQYFYSQQLERAEFYIDRAINGKIEINTSAPRMLATNWIKNDKYLSRKGDKYDFKCYHVTRDMHDKVVNQTHSCIAALLIIKDL
jgi:tetratricopeptide (TPR) repeat protein